MARPSVFGHRNNVVTILENMNRIQILLSDEYLVGSVADEIYKLNDGQRLFLILILVAASIILYFLFRNFWNIIDHMTCKYRSLRKKIENP